MTPTRQELVTSAACLICPDQQTEEAVKIALLSTLAGGSFNLTTSSPAGAQTATAASAANAARKRFTIQNLKAELLYVKLGETATTSSYHFILPTQYASWTVDGYVGAISVAPASGSPSYTLTEYV